MNQEQQKERQTLGRELRAEMAKLNEDVELVVAQYQADAKKAVLSALEETRQTKLDLKKEFDEHIAHLEEVLKYRGIVQAKELLDATEPLRRPFVGRIKWAIRGR